MLHGIRGNTPRAGFGRRCKQPKLFFYYDVLFLDAMCKAYKKGRGKRRDAGEDEAETSADESRADPGTGEPEQTASAAEGTLGRGTRRAATSTDYGGPVARRRRAEDGEAEQTRRARRGREQDFAEISRRMYEEIRSSRDPRDHVEDG